MDVALKQRLVGASVLVIFSVTFIPMLLDGPPSSRVEAPIAIPQAPDARFETRLLPVGQEAGSQTQRPPAQSVPAEELRPPSVVATSAAGTASQPSAVRLKPSVQPSGGSASNNAGVASESTPPPARRAPVQADGQPNNRSPAEAIPGSRAGSAGSWVLQVGSFGNAANAARLVDRLQGGQWQAYQEKVQVGSNSLYRVRVRGWADKSSALDAGERLLKAFTDIELSVREITSNAGTAAQTAVSVQGWMVQLGSFNSQNNATALRDKLRGAGFSANLSDAGAGASARYRVRVGPELNEASAKATREQIRQRVGLSGIVIDHP